MNKGELVSSIADKAGLSKLSAERTLNAVLETITQELQSGGNVTLIGFGSFQISERAARKGRNPATGAEINIAASKLPTFKAGRGLKDAVNS